MSIPKLNFQKMKSDEALAVGGSQSARVTASTAAPAVDPYAKMPYTARSSLLGVGGGGGRKVGIPIPPGQPSVLEPGIRLGGREAELWRRMGIGVGRPSRCARR